ncbi:MAG: hypothetical protein IPK26_18930 [Planctomycetes bacterium]|nr:hypothetical protein [Planctomycetota bacterium]
MKPRLLGATAGLLSVLSACQGPGDASGDEPGLTAVQFQDVAVPDGFLLKSDLRESYSREERGWRIGHFVYTHNSVRVDDASAHLRARMPQHNWTLVGDEQVDEQSRRLRFVRTPYSVEYLLNRQDGITRMTVDYRTESPNQ